MTAVGTVCTASGGFYQVIIGGQLSAKIPAVHNAYRLEIDFEAKKWEERPPQVGDRVLCIFPGEAYVDGWIVGILEG